MEKKKKKGKTHSDEKDTFQALSDINLTTVDGDKVNFSSLWENQQALVMWVRHFGWNTCMLVVDKYSQQKEAFAAASTNLVFIGHGGDAKAREYAKHFNLPALYLDKDRKSHAVLDLKVSGWMEMLTDKEGIAKSSEARKKGFKIALFGVGNVKQLGGIALIDKSGIKYTYRCQTTYDYPEVEEVLRICQREETTTKETENTEPEPESVKADMGQSSE